MKLNRVFALAIACFPFLLNAQIAYPESKVDPVVETLHGKKVIDNYRWMEDLEAPETMKWAAAQSNLTREYLNAIPARAKIEKRLTEVQDYLRQSPPFKEGKSFYYYKNDGLQDQSVLIELTSFSAPEKVYLDPNTFSQDGSKTMSGVSFSNNGSWSAYSVSEKGSDWKTIKVMDHRSRRPMRDELKNVKFSGIHWMENGFFYKAYPAPKAGEKYSGKNTDAKIYYHKVGDAQSADQVVWEKSDLSYTIFLNDDESLVFLSGYKDQGNSLSYRFNGTKKVTGDFTPIATGTKYSYSVVDNDENILYLKTNEGAHNFKLIQIDLRKPAKEKWKTLIEENPSMKMTSIKRVGEHFVATYMKDGVHVMKAFDLKGKFEQDLKLPGMGRVGGIYGKKNSKNVYFSYTSYTHPQSVLKLSLSTLRVSTFYQPEIDFDPREYTVKKVEYPSKDGTKVPMYIMYKGQIAMFNDNPTFLYGYGGFGISQLPSYRPHYIPFLENGGVIAIANLRGGSEKGKAWHDAGRLLKKQNVFDDFIAAARYLIGEKYTSEEKLAIGGRSNGGLLVGAVMAQEPSLFKAAVPTVGVMDMLRFHMFTIGHAWTKEYGSPDTKAHFDNLYGYSPYHNLKEGTNYPATLVFTGANDDRVVPSHSYKFTAALQATGSKNPSYLMSYPGKAHKNSTTSQKIQEWTDRWAFLFDQLGMKME